MRDQSTLPVVEMTKMNKPHRYQSEWRACHLHAHACSISRTTQDCQIQEQAIDFLDEDKAGREPGKWQTCDLTLVDRHVTVVLNGVTVIDNEPIEGPTGGATHIYPTAPGPIHLQGDYTSVKYWNIYLAPVVRD